MDGLLTPESVVERWNTRSDQITEALVAESARWGDYRRDVDSIGTPLLLLERDVHWVAEREPPDERLLPEPDGHGDPAVPLCWHVPVLRRSNVFSQRGGNCL